MGAFYVTIIFLGVILVAVSLFLILMDRANGKDFFKEFDRKKDEMFGLIQDSEEMIHELNRMSDYVVTVISEKNQEFFKKVKDMDDQDKVEEKPVNQIQQQIQIEEPIISTPELSTEVDKINQQINQDIQKLTNIQSYRNMQSGIKQQNEANDEIIDTREDIEKPSKLVLNSRRKQVLQLIEQGFSNDEIAEKMKMGKGEIGLIRGLSGSK
ncbi:regulatory protein LuxR [Ruminiclostridium papyrosolvens DSM 2782]|uniref:Regulatory protein LuxR n=1 Tax=Ruminiclostridium papyrosolvens DSM 2782 TaxID=588581 RepID=F1THL8_9FIRM|nr:response regulator transcription factor [Ruminiclostridium papyrosolvens]EGD46000.1 regulatory protein LuxR [Ruminiclostridium papyrosolvens DSM 2782]WES32801.1 response regulator transcription factor [Ruminiclostridium papyrosolvens DSM 2782]